LGSRSFFPSPIGRGFKERDLAQRAVPFARDSRFCRIRTEEFLDLGQDFVAVLQHLVIPKSQDTVAVRFEKRATNLIFGGLVGMLAAIDFDDQLSLNRAEIDEVRTDGMLAAEFHVAHAFGSQMTPENLLRSSLLAAQSASGFVRCFGRGHDFMKVRFPGRTQGTQRTKISNRARSRSSPLPSGEDLRRGTLLSARFLSRAIQDSEESEPWNFWILASTSSVFPTT